MAQTDWVRQQYPAWKDASDDEIIDHYASSMGLDRATAATYLGVTPPAPSGAMRRVLGDSGVDLAKGVVGLGQGAVGLADLASGGAAGRGLRTVGYDPERTQDFLSGFYSPERQAAEQEVAQADGFVDTTKAMVRNPSTIAGAAIQSAPTLLSGTAGASVALRFLRPEVIKAAQAGDEAAIALVKSVSRWGAGVGEGGITAGSVAADISERNPDDPSAMYWGLPAGLATAAISRASAGLGGGIEAAMATRGIRGMDGNILARTAKAAIGEGVVEELPQSMQEQAFTNIGTNRPLEEGVGKAGAQGMLAGMAAGGAVAPFLGNRTPYNVLSDANPQPTPYGDQASFGPGQAMPLQPMQAPADPQASLGFPFRPDTRPAPGQVNQPGAGIPGQAQDMFGYQVPTTGEGQFSARPAEPTRVMPALGRPTSVATGAVPAVPASQQPSQGTKPPSKSTKQEEQIPDTELGEVFGKYAIETKTPSGATAYVIQGKLYHKAEHAKSILSKLAKAEQAKDPVRRDAERHLAKVLKEQNRNAMSEGRISLSEATFKAYENLTDAAASLEEVADRINAERKALAMKPGKSTQVRMGVLDQWLEEMGQPALDVSKIAEETKAAAKPAEKKPAAPKKDKIAKGVAEQQAKEAAKEPGFNPDVVLREAGRITQEHLGKLDTATKALVERHLAENESAEAIGAELGVTGEAVRKRAKAAVEELRAALTAAELDDATIKAALKAKRTQVAADDKNASVSKLDTGELFEDDEGGGQQTMGTIGSVGGSQANIGKFKEDSDEEIQALKKGGEAAKAAVEKARKVDARKKAEVLSEAGKGREVKEKELAPAKRKVQRVKKDGTVVTAEEVKAAVDEGIKDDAPLAEDDKRKDMSKDVVQPDENEVKVTEADKAKDKALASEVKKIEGPTAYAKLLWDEATFPGKPQWDALTDKAREMWVEYVNEGKTGLADMSRLVERYGAEQQEKSPALKNALAEALGKDTDTVAQAVDENRRGFLKALGAIGAFYAAPRSVRAAVQKPGLAELVTKGATIDQTLGWIERHGSTEMARELAKTLRPLMPEKMPLRVVRTRRGEASVGAPDAIHHAYGVTQINRRDGTLAMFLRRGDGIDGVKEETILHEAVHAAILARYDLLNYYAANPQLAGSHAATEAIREFAKVYLEFRQMAKAEATRSDAPTFLKEAYGSPDEFMTWALTNSEFQTYLESKKYEGKTLWARFKEALRKILGVQLLKNDQTWFDAAVLASGRVLEAAQRDAADFAAPRRFAGALASKTSNMQQASGNTRAVPDFIPGPTDEEYKERVNQYYKDLQQRPKTKLLTSDEIRNHPVVDAALADLDGLGLGHFADGAVVFAEAPALNGAQISREIKFDKKTGTFSAYYLVEFGSELLRSFDLRGELRFSARHEIAHAVDRADWSGVYSASGEFGIVPQSRMAKGEVSQEIAEFYERNKKEPRNQTRETAIKWAMADAFAYPLSEDYGLEGIRVQTELFAQALALYSSPTYHKPLQELLPKTAAYLDKVIAHATQEQAADFSAQEALDHEARWKASLAKAGDNRRGDVGSRPKAGGTHASRRAVSDTLPAHLQEPVSTITDTVSGLAKNGLLAASFGHDLADMAAKRLPSARKYFDLLGEKGAKKNHLETQVSKVMQEFTSLPANTQDAVNKFIDDATTKGLWAYAPAWKTDAPIDEGMKQRFNALPAAAQRVVRQVFDHGHSVLEQKRKLFNKALNDVYDAQRDLLKSQGATPAELAEVEQQRRSDLALYGRTFTELDGPYAPKRRSGEYVVVAKSKAFLEAEAAEDTAALEKLKQDEAHYVVRFEHTEASAKRLERAMARSFPDGRVEWSPREAFISSNVPRWQELSKIRDKAVAYLSESDTEAGKAMARTFNRVVGDMYLHALSETSARKTEMRRRNVAGYEENMMLSFSAQGRADAHLLASLEKHDEINKVLQAMRREAHAPGDRGEKMRLLNEVLRRHEASMNYQPAGWQDMALRGTSVWMLLTSPGYFFQNLTQTFMLTQPVLTGRFGSRAWGAILDGYRDLTALAKKSPELIHLDLSKHVSRTGDEGAMLQRLLDLGIIDIGIEQDFGDPDAQHGVVSKAFEQVSSKLGRIARRVEVINRVSSALAAYRLHYNEAIRDGKQPEQAHLDATKYAGDVVRQTHGDYSAFNAPRILMSGAFPGVPVRLIGQFRKFQIIQISLLARLYNQAFKGATAEERAIGRKQLAWTLGHTFTMAGALGSPLVPLAAKALAMAFGDDGEDEETFLRRAIDNKAVADLLLKGAPAAAGVNLSGKIGMGQTFSPLPFLDGTPFEGKDGYAKTLMAISGAFLGGLLPRAADGAAAISEGRYYKGMEMLLPKGLGDAMKAYRFATEGVTTRRGDVMLAPDEVTLFDAFSQMLGLPSMTLTERTRVQGVVIEREEHFKQRSASLRDAYSAARRKGDVQAMQSVRGEWQDLQEARARAGFMRQPLSALLRAPIEQAKREREARGGIPTSRQNRRFVEQVLED